MNRRDFIQSSVAVSAVGTSLASTPIQNPSRPVVIASANGLAATEKAMRLIRKGGDTLDAVVSGVNIVENDPEDRSVGYGGLPNEEGVVQLDSSVMHGPTGGAGAVSALEGIKNPSLVAKLVMERTDHVLLTGRGAKRFALAMGFKEENLLTDESREIWMRWKAGLSEKDDWIEPSERLPADKRAAAEPYERHTGTINCNAVDVNGNVSGVTTTSGLAFKIPGRVGDSPIIGAGLYVDNQVGACGSTGRGEANLKSCASFLAVEFMRQGDSPEEAGLKVLRRIADSTSEPYLLNDKGQPRFNLNFYLLNKKGEFAGVALWSGGRYAAHNGRENKHYDSAYLYKRAPKRR